MSNKQFINNLSATYADVRRLDAKVINAKKIKLNGEPIPSKVLDDRGDFVTDQDLWGTSVTTDENGVVHVSHKWVTNPNGEEAWNSSVNSVKDNKAYTSTDATGEPLCNIQTEMIKDGSYMFFRTSLESFSSDLSSLMDSSYMFFQSSIKSFSGDLSNLVNGYKMFYNTSLGSFSGDLGSLINGGSMFYNTSLGSFSGDLGSLVNGDSMFASTSIESFSGDLSSLVDGASMFSSTPLELFGSDLSSLAHGEYMFEGTSLTLFNKDLNSLADGSWMFSSTPLASFGSNLSSLINGWSMFNSTPLTSFNGNLSSLVNGSGMFFNTSLKSFSSDLSSLVNCVEMFYKTHERGYKISHLKMVDGIRKLVAEHFKAEGLTSFSGDLGSLQTGYYMFGDAQNVTYENEEGVTETTKNITPLDEQSLMIIADTIKDLNGFIDWDSSISSSRRGKIHIGYDSEVCDAAKVEEYCTEIMNKGWTVYLNGTLQTTDDGIEGIATLAEDGTITVTPIPYYCKPLEVEQKEAEWTDGEKYYIILGAQKVFGDDLSTYGMFTSIENAAMNMGFTPYEYVEEETVEEN